LSVNNRTGLNLPPPEAGELRKKKAVFQPKRKVNKLNVSNPLFFFNHQKYADKSGQTGQ